MSDESSSTDTTAVPDDDGPSRRRYPRRPVLGWLVAGGGAVLLGAVTRPWEPTGLVGDLLGSLLAPAGTTVPTAPLLAVRADDGVMLSLSFVNLQIRTGSGPPQLALTSAGTDGQVIVTLPSQSLLEMAFFNKTPPSRPAPALPSGPSRIVLRVPAGTAPFPYDLPTLLDLARFPLAVSPHATAASPGVPTRAPLPGETSIEAPFRLFLSPPDTALFVAAKAPVTRNGRTELWHARAVPRPDKGTPGGVPAQVPVRAIWATDMDTSPPDLPDWARDGSGSVSLYPADRKAIVQKTTAVGPAPASLMLVSPMGTSLDVDGTWPTGSPGSGLIGWRHRSWLGRDNFVKIEDAGYLFPLGFPAMRVAITERTFGSGLAFLRRVEYIVVRQPTVDLSSGPQPHGGLGQPFVKATTSTITSPPIPPFPVAAGYDWVTVADASGKPAGLLRYKVTLTTKDNTTVTTDMPLIFVDQNLAEKTAPLQPVLDLYNQADTDRRTLVLGGQKVGYVAPVAGVDHSLATTAILLHAEAAAADTPGHLAAFPVMDTADVHIEALDALGGPQGTVVQLSYPRLYLDHGFDGTNNVGEVWATLAPPPPPAGVPLAAPAAPTPAPLQFALSQETGGGLAAPKFAVEGLSRAHGTIRDAQSIAKNMFQPAMYFPNAEMLGIKLLGAIPLSEVIKKPDAGPDAQNIPKTTTKRTGDTVETIVTWDPELDTLRLPGGLCTFMPKTGERLHLEVRLTASADGKTSSVVRGELHNAALVFLGMISQPIERLHFESRDGATPTIDLKLGTPMFEGDLRFLTKLKDYLPALPGGVKIDQSPAGIKAGVTLAVPAVPLGAVLIQNLSVGVLFDLPFNGDPARLFFSFAEREHPFRCTVMALGGGGYLKIGLSLNGGRPSIEGALEFGAAVAIDLGVASGSVSIMAGVFIAFGTKTDSQTSTSGNSVVITGYVRAIGELSVLGLIHISVEFYLGLTFSKDSGAVEARVEGEATLRVRVEVFFFSTSVSLTVRKEIGAGVDPSFGEQISAADWSAYCAAFA